MAPTYCDWSPSAPGWGPRGFGIDVRPLPESTRIRRPSGVNRTPVGYQPVGMKPATRLADGRATSTTATALLSALATSSVRPSGESAEGVGRRARRRAGREGDRNLLGRGSRSEIDRPDGVRVRARDEEALPVRRQDHGVGMLSHGKRAPGLERRRVEEQHLRAAPERDEERRSIRGNEAGIGLRRQIHPLRDLAGRKVQRRQPLSEHVHDVEPGSVGPDRETSEEPFLDGLADGERPAGLQFPGLARRARGPFRRRRPKRRDACRRDARRGRARRRPRKSCRGSTTCRAPRPSASASRSRCW